ncbi:unnamed protein product [Prunus armeniaca]|uniref:Uncharacterized protein n=1 Tax=Prunus armeniaca TaxID=36596 RepID=A0A6J5Y0W3_PRUAR|nr:unnamed protein product [Prunus armeniaca]
MLGVWHGDLSVELKSSDDLSSFGQLLVGLTQKLPFGSSHTGHVQPHADQLSHATQALPLASVERKGRNCAGPRFGKWRIGPRGLVP